MNCQKAKSSLCQHSKTREHMIEQYIANEAKEVLQHLHTHKFLCIFRTYISVSSTYRVEKIFPCGLSSIVIFSVLVHMLRDHNTFTFRLDMKCHIETERNIRWFTSTHYCGRRESLTAAYCCSQKNSGQEQGGRSRQRQQRSHQKLLAFFNSEGCK